MTQKGGLFKGQQKKTPAANRHGKRLHVKKGKLAKEPKKRGSDYFASKEVSKFINAANEAKAAAVAAKDGAQLSIVKPPPPDTDTKTKTKAKPVSRPGKK